MSEQSSSANELKQAALDYHRLQPHGKIKVSATKPMVTQRDLALAYSPGVAVRLRGDRRRPQCGQRAHRARQPGGGDHQRHRGARPGRHRPAGRQAGDGRQGRAVPEVRRHRRVRHRDRRDATRTSWSTSSPALEPTFGGINLEDIKAPECFIVERKLRERMKIPVFHDDQHGTAIIVGAAVLNALEVVGKNIGEVKLATTGAGAAGIACLDMLVALGAEDGEHHRLRPRRRDLRRPRAPGPGQGALRAARPTRARWPRSSTAPTSSWACRPAACSSRRWSPRWRSARSSWRWPIPYPEILPEDAKAVRPDCIIATGRSDYPNQVNNALCFPYIFRGALDVGATGINEAMKLACVHAIADLARMRVGRPVARPTAAMCRRSAPTTSSRARSTRACWSSSPRPWRRPRWNRASPRVPSRTWRRTRKSSARSSTAPAW